MLNFNHKFHTFPHRHSFSISFLIVTNPLQIKKKKKRDKLFSMILIGSA